MRDCMSCWYNLIVHNIGGLGMARIASGSHAHPFLRVFGEVPSMPVDPVSVRERVCCGPISSVLVVKKADILSHYKHY